MEILFDEKGEEGDGRNGAISTISLHDGDVKERKDVKESIDTLTSGQSSVTRSKGEKSGKFSSSRNASGKRVNNQQKQERSFRDRLYGNTTTKTLDMWHLKTNGILKQSHQKIMG